MKAAKYILIIIGIGIIGLVLYALNQSNVIQSSIFDTEGNNQDVTSLISATYNNDQGETLKLVYDNEKSQVIVYHNDGSSQVLPQVISASGARYANEDESYVVWNKGDEITVFKNDTIIFQGTTENELDNIETIDTNVSSDDTRGDSLVGTWKWEKTEMSSDEGINPQPKSEKFTLTFDSKGNVSGTTDCNNFGGSYSTNDGIINFGPMNSTLMYCENSQESEFLNLLNNIQSYMLTDAGKLVLMLKMDSGSVIFGSVSKNDDSQSQEFSFKGTLQEVNTGCFADGECYIMVDGKHVTAIRGWSQDTVGTIIGVDGFGDLESHLGEQVEVFARKTENNTYTLYGSADYYIKVK